MANMSEKERLVELLQGWGNKENDGVRAESIADYLLENGVVVPPVKVGQKVYDISEEFIAPCTVKIIYLADYTDRDGNSSYVAEIRFDKEDCPYVAKEIYFTDIGKTVFLTKEQAEKALKGGAE